MVPPWSTVVAGCSSFLCVESMSGARGRTRTCDLPVISRVLQPTKLPAQWQVADKPPRHNSDGIN